MKPITIKKLTEAYEFILKEKEEKGKIENPLVIAQLQDSNGYANAYLIAKDPSKDLFYGVLESKTILSEKIIAGIPLSNLQAIELREISFRPFRLKKYLNEGIKEYIKEDIIRHYLFMNPQLEIDLKYVRYLKDDDYLFTEEGRIISNLIINKDIKSLPIVIMRTLKAIEIIGKKDDKYLFTFEEGIPGLPNPTEVLPLMEQLISNCYGVKTVEEFFSKSYHSNNPLLIHFTEILKYEFNDSIVEILSLMVRPELNPNLSIDDIVYGKTMAELLLFNQFACDNHFKKYLQLR